jgi:TolA-binding protein
MQRDLKVILIFSILFLFTGCLKTADQIEREKKVDNLSEELTASHKTVADLMLLVKEQQAKINAINGQFEEIEHKQTTQTSRVVDDLKKQISLLNEQVSALQNDNKALNTKMEELSTKVDEQKAFIEKVTHSLGKMSSDTKGQDESTSDIGDAYEKAVKLMAAKKYNDAKDIFLELIADKSQKASIVNKSHFQLGMIEFKRKKYEDALVFFSKVYTQYPESSVAPSALFHLGKSFKAMKKVEEANSSFSELIEKYPKAKEASLAKKELK